MDGADTCPNPDPRLRLYDDDDCPPGDTREGGMSNSRWTSEIIQLPAFATFEGVGTGEANE
eukprot:CAMPEP_0204639724 /NCGR_PEP_ID=MMETSP0717-20131115/44116_1 /ASSEMBLY_ACC=CAM_ASM_000666 /TAXON_ID=230516 /ORGANISM="Chaetoceros curvisetus" /LENGTH=60 /DNA_ID=CAMNT_0051659913 /DNA_START=642 /DNA_END=824 /DNA_ORIENTATION=+